MRPKRLPASGLRARYLPLLIAMLLAMPACAGSSATPAATTVYDAAATATDSGQAESDTAAATDVATTEDTASQDTSLPPPQDAGPVAAPDAIKPVVQITANDAPPGKGLPQFVAVKDSTGALVKADDLKGKWTVIWFYPAASTFG